MSNYNTIRYTNYSDTAISNLLDGAPDSLNTLNELAAALGDDANFASTVTNSLATKLTSSSNLNASNLSTGTLPDARFPSTLPAVSGANLTGLSGGLSHISVATGNYSGHNANNNQSQVIKSDSLGNAPNDAKGGILTITGKMHNYGEYCKIYDIQGASTPLVEIAGQLPSNEWFIDSIPFTCSGGASLTLRTAQKKDNNDGYSRNVCDNRRWHILYLG